MKAQLSILLVSAWATSGSFAAWVWHESGTETILGVGSDGNFTLTPVGANYDLSNSNDGTGFDQAPTPVSFTWSSGSEPIQIVIDSSGEYFDFDLDPDNDNVLPASVSIDVLYFKGISERGIEGGGLFANVNPLGSVLDFELSVFDTELNQIVLSGINEFRTSFGATEPTSFSMGSAIFDDISNNGRPVRNQNAFPGLTSGDSSDSHNATVAFPRGSTDPIEAAGALLLEFSDFSAGEEFRLSFDGGLDANALTVVPEPSAILLTSFVSLGLLHRRRTS